MEKNYETLIEKYKLLIYSIASKFPGFDKEELFQAGRIGLTKAMNNYKGGYDAKFSSYLYHYIHGEMYEFCQERKTIKVNKDTLRLCRKFEEARNHIYQNTGSLPTDLDIAAFLDVDSSVIKRVEAATITMLSLDTTYDDDNNLYDIIADKPQDIDDKLDIKDLMNSLNKEEKKIIDYRYFKDFTQSETAKAMCMSQAKVSRYETKSLEKMRQIVH